LGNGHSITLAYAALVLSFAVLLFGVTDRTVNSPFGRLLKAIRDDELVAKSFGKVVPTRKAQVLIVASAMSALAGALYTFFIGYENAASFTTVWTINAWIMVILGGMANNRGALLGAFLLTAMDSTSSLVVALVGVYPGFEISYLRNMVVAALVILVMVFRPKGLFPEKPLRIPFRTSSE
jgi:branched-chain amino acid transport system permease protein